MNNEQYQNNEILRFHKRMAACESESHHLQKEESSRLLDDMVKGPDYLKQLAGYLLDGNYGCDPYYYWRNTVEPSKMNKVSCLMQILGVYEYQVKGTKTRKLWKSLTKEQQEKLNAAMAEAIKEDLESREED